ncbi:hypothetical protein FSP39_000515 [Pinctada imbricata]|uniref:DUF5641 domain-containing protein n=1 Tax=Pinctada imbricata TaxID=66713 RepID=A0AA88YT17_PINIB|nr:hypothetical protein FSP39_000515 [Pinctada imbricata]
MGYLQNLQLRRKWQTEKPNLKEGDVIMLRDKDVARGQWPLGVITETIPSRDGLVRTVLVRVMKDGKPSIYKRPISEVVRLVD